ncbi:hypothetical protein DDB_G0288577 [Dictyostelium discoideum AX4]|uniref:Putative uncharacterized protein DDB_G0288577 n=1 Tax=Dictyostelium discoideum TaxID=44689 RepID=Y8002_DICDI|nr:hypothetical protein DDB_G0288577 [Dictyostelium discoideum AX4]Q54IR1.1 RecName: Full=Putative uncharacterized protein DDB_G0288577 [Dictyostelium discoideum]EAL63148.1 hypothetical protein DDB_G0288577 [Dictyostelium discoideum AX4]|eukprot:XP_636653.1 hypothetical protein DDB_G0288577 [Dictyostelium discoideum AX4]
MVNNDAKIGRREFYDRVESVRPKSPPRERPTYTYSNSRTVDGYSNRGPRADF